MATSDELRYVGDVGTCGKREHHEMDRSLTVNDPMHSREGVQSMESRKCFQELLRTSEELSSAFNTNIALPGQWATRLTLSVNNKQKNS